MRKLMLPLLAVLTVTPLALLAACTDTAEESSTAEPSSATPTATAVADTPTATKERSAEAAGCEEGGCTAIPITTPFPSPAPVPEDWPTYTDSRGRFTVHYPPTWFAESNGELYSVDPRSRTGIAPPPNSINVEIGSYPEDGSGCGLLRIDPENGELVFEEPEVAPATVDGVSGGQILRVSDPVPDLPDQVMTRIHGFSVIHKGYCFHIGAYFVQDNPDEATFLQIVSSFRFADFPAVDERP